MFTLAIFLAIISITTTYNGDLHPLECPDDCDCYYFRINWVTDCSESNLTDIPYHEISLNVYILDLNGNYIKDIKQFPEDIKMRRLQIADNLITEIRKDSFVGLNYLIDADFSGNKITKINPDAFEDCTGLITLELQGNPLEDIPHGPFLTMKSLLYLDISNCTISHLNAEFFTGLGSLSTLDLSNNPLKFIENHVFAPLEHLESLKMSECNLTHIGERAFQQQMNLKTLDLSGNMLIDIDLTPVLVHLIRLENLDLSNSHVSKVAEDTFNNANYLRVLNLARNELQHFDVASTIGNKLPHLDVLDLSYCNLMEPLSEDAFSNATKIRELYLDGNTLFASDLLVALPPLYKLQKLSLSNCGLSKLPNTFDKIKTLQVLDISHNPLNDVFVSLIEPLENLEYLNMGYSNLSHISVTTFSKMTSMKRLILSGNDLNSLEAGLFSNLTSLESLELNFCGLRRTLNATVFFNNFTYTDLMELQLAGNPLRVSPTGPLLPKQLSRLQTLDLSNCNLTYLPTDAFYWARNITHLYLSRNYFSHPDELKFLTMLNKLKLLDLTHNVLSTLSYKQLDSLRDLEKLKLVGNPWKCNCSIAEIWDWALIKKKDITVLEGSQVTAEDVKAGKEKRKRLLLCYYDLKIEQPLMKSNKTVPGRLPFVNPAKLITATNRTWAKYVRESGCETRIKLDSTDNVNKS